MAPNLGLMLLRLFFVLHVGALVVGPVDGRAQGIRDSAGVRLATYARLATPREKWNLTTRPLLAVRSTDDAATQFTAVRGVIRLDDGTIAVADGGSNAIRLFSREGHPLRVFGRAGGGPGEFRRLTRLLRRGDTLIGVDGDSRAHVFHSEGQLIRSFRPARRLGSRNPQRLGLGPGSASYVLVTDGSPQAERERQVILQTLTLSDAAGDSLVPVVTVPAFRTNPIKGVPARLLLDAVGVITASESRVCSGYSDQYVITCYEPTGRVRLRIKRDVASRDIRDAERAMVRQAYLDANRDAPPAVRQQMETAVMDLPFAATAPVFSRLVFGANGELWVSPFDAGYGLPGPAAPLAPATPRTWNVFAPDGTWRADVTLPPRFVPFDFGRDYVAGLAFDEDDVERVVVWGLRR